MLICGERVGAAKLNKARTLGVQLLSEDEYLALIQ
jgi:NAD-dependent DNA ligase